MQPLRDCPQPRIWKELKQHDESARYRDILGPTWAKLVETVRKFGIIGGRCIVLFEGKILDGWQLQRACIECDVKPKYATLPEGMAVEEYVEVMNDLRRHETQEAAEARIEERRERIAKARAAGESLRTIAEKEGVSEKTVRTDLEASTAEGYAVDPPDGKVTGKDGKKKPASTKKLCHSCQHRKDVGKPLIEKCEDCKELNKKPPKTKPDPIKEEEVTDALKKPVPKNLQDVFAKTAEFRSILHALALLKARCKELGKHEAGGWLDHQDLDRMLSQAHTHLRFAMPYTECPKCRRKKNAKCTACKGTLWINETVYGSASSDADKAWLEERS